MAGDVISAKKTKTRGRTTSPLCTCVFFACVITVQMFVCCECCLAVLGGMDGGVVEWMFGPVGGSWVGE